jgi:hypothetical protein
MGKSMKKLLITLLTLALTACAGSGSIKWDDARQIKIGMTGKEVTKLMGTPYQIQGIGERDRWVWVNVVAFGGAEKMTAEFKDGVVVEVPRVPESFGK